MAKAKKEAALTPEERLQAALVPDWEWPYKLPENWCWTRIGMVSNFERGITFPAAAKEAAPTEDNIPCLRTANVQENLEIDDMIYVNRGFMKGNIAKLVRENDIIMSSANSRELVGKSSLVTHIPFPMTFGGFVLNIRAKEMSSKYLFYFLRHEFLAGKFIGESSQTTNIANINTTTLGNYEIPLPPLPEQQRIVDRIESLFSKLDEAKEKAQAVLDSFETRKAAILHKAFTGELTAKWREEHYATDNTVLMDIKNYSSSWSAKEKDLLSREQAKSEVVVLDNGHEWIRCTIGAVGRVTNGSTPLRKEPKYWSGKIPWISSGEVRNNIIESSNECISEEGYANSSVKLLPIGTVLIAMIGEGKTRGQSAILNIEATINQNVAAIVVEHNCVLPYYIWYWLQMNYTKNREKGSGSGPQALNCQRVRELDFFVPNLKEQKEVVNILRKALAQEQQAKEAAEAVLDQIDLMKKSILARAFHGELGTNDPNEESAVELLKKVF